MQAIRVHEFGEPGVMTLETVGDLKAGAGQVVVRVQAVGVNPVDTYIRAGVYPVRPELPYTPGMDAAGVVQEVGEHVRGLAKGDRAYVAGSVSGTYAARVLCQAEQVWPLPDRVSFAQGAALGVPYATAYRALFDRGEARPGEVVLVHGASGGVGTAAVQLARAAGVMVIGTAGTEEGRKLVAEQGADFVLDHTREGYLGEVLELTDGRGADVVLEMLANVNLGKDLGVLAKRGRVVVIGSRGPVEINPRDLMGRDADVRGMSIMNASPEARRRIHRALGAGLGTGVLRPVVGREMTLAEAAEAHRQVIEGRAYGKIVLIP